MRLVHKAGRQWWVTGIKRQVHEHTSPQLILAKRWRGMFYDAIARVSFHIFLMRKKEAVLPSYQ